MTTASTPQEDLAKQMQESAALFARMGANSVPYRNEMREVVDQLNRMSDGVTDIVKRWKTEYLAKAKPYDKSNPSGQDFA